MMRTISAAQRSWKEFRIRAAFWWESRLFIWRSKNSINDRQTLRPALIIIYNSESLSFCWDITLILRHRFMGNNKNKIGKYFKYWIACISYISYRFPFFGFKYKINQIIFCAPNKYSVTNSQIYEWSNEYNWHSSLLKDNKIKLLKY